jgi:uncharacterized protein YjbI with pentapeptide repeats
MTRPLPTLIARQIEQHARWIAEQTGQPLQLRRADWRKLHLAGYLLSEASLHAARLDEADLTGALLLDADLHKASLVRADLTDALLIGAMLEDARLSHANLTRASLCGAQLAGATLTGARLDRTILSGATGLDRVRVDWMLVGKRRLEGAPARAFLRAAASLPHTQSA